MFLEKIQEELAVIAEPIITILISAVEKSSTKDFQCNGILWNAGIAAKLFHKIPFAVRKQDKDSHCFLLYLSE
jgi:hypothetical protein